MHRPPATPKASICTSTSAARAKNPGDVAPRRFLEAIAGPGQPPLSANTSGRLELAQRMTSPENPLLARVMVNRIWHHLMGVGVVPSTDNFGLLGEKPSNPELLDYLAARFAQDGGSVKRAIRSIMLSRTYQMASASEVNFDELDPDDRLLHRMRVRRLEGEAIRDQILSVSGRLDPTMFGPPVDVYLTPFMEGRGRPASGPLDGDGRRSIYISIKRNFLSPMMLAFDTPIPFSCAGRRSVSNVPAQALILMNDPFVVEQAKLWADRTLAAAGLTPAERVDRMYREAFGRPAESAELEAALAFLKQQASELAVADGHTADDRAAWADLAHALMNVKEFIFIK